MTKKLKELNCSLPPLIAAYMNLSSENLMILSRLVNPLANLTDIRNSKVVDVINELKSFSCHVEVVDPHANSKSFLNQG
ncbi:hypothetical protein N9K77_02125 [bacterium]|nr:hypothetical protein [bacterium]